MSKPAARIHLLNEFAIKPLLSDLAHILAQLDDVIAEAEKEFKLAGEETQKSHYSETYVHDQNMINYYSTNEKTWGMRVSSKFAATLSYKYRYTCREGLAAFAKYWGLNSNFEAMWNMIPFSFLWDYFNKVAQAIHAMEIDPNVDILPYQYCESVLNESTSGTYCWQNNSRITSMSMVLDGKLVKDTTQPIFVHGLRSSHYERKLTLPNKGTALPRIASPSWTQKTNMLALARVFLPY